jgi:primosomal protein N' (replication factor Y) (superfamily II helicase)
MSDAAANSHPQGKFVQVALPVPLRQTFTYRIPPALIGEIGIGARIIVPFGKRMLTGYAVSFADEPPAGSDFDLDSIKDVSELIDPEPMITHEVMDLAEWVADYYAGSLGEVLKASLPAGINAAMERFVSATVEGRRALGSSVGKKALKWEILRSVAETDEVSTKDLEGDFGSGATRAVRELARDGLVNVTLRRSASHVRPKRRKAVRLLSPNQDGGRALTEPQQRVLDSLSAAGGSMLFTDVLESADVGASPINTLAKRGLLQVTTEEVLRDPLAGAELPESAGIVLNPGQSGILTTLCEALDAENYSAFLLHGVTGSGKTEVYIRTMTHALRSGRSSMMLVPEIALTPIFSRRLRSVFGDEVAILHSNLSPGERFDEWRRIRSGSARIAIGTRSAVFAPLESLGLVIVDEEHDESYRQNEHPFYNGRDVAIMQAHQAGAVVVLGSATPSLESFHNAHQGKYRYLHLPGRIGDRPLAKAELIDMREVFRRSGKDVVFSPPLLEAIAETHARGEQSMILLNRRGFSSFVLCRSCGETLRCKNCDISLTYHRQNDRVMCHYCNYTVDTPKVCPFCESEFLYFMGQGTEQIEDILVKRFPDLRIARIDRDSMSRKGELTKRLLAFDRGEIDMLVGTQMLAKGHDFHNVTLVGVVSVDTGLGLPDFRSAERTFQLLTQVAGRAGRGKLAGKVLIQTYYPEHYALKYAAEQDYEGFYKAELNYRRRMGYPPFVVLAAIGIKHRDRDYAMKTGRILREALDHANSGGESRILGPAQASIARLKGEYRFQIIIKSQSRKAQRELLNTALPQAEALGADRRAMSVQIDPLSLL